jgi:hypothetical protein
VRTTSIRFVRLSHRVISKKASSNRAESAPSMMRVSPEDSKILTAVRSVGCNARRGYTRRHPTVN